MSNIICQKQIITDVENLLSNGAKRFSSWFKSYKPWHENNGITERNLSHQVSISFLNHFENGHVFMEVPFSTDGKKNNKHLDAYLFNDHYAIFLECKTVWAQSHISSVIDDINRIPYMIEHIQGRHVDKNNIPIPFAMILVETWRDYVAHWWKGDSSAAKWPRNILPKDWYYNFIEVHKEHNGFEGTLYWLYAISPELTNI